MAVTIPEARLAGHSGMVKLRYTGQNTVQFTCGGRAYKFSPEKRENWVAEEDLKTLTVLGPFETVENSNGSALSSGEANSAQS